MTVKKLKYEIKQKEKEKENLESPPPCLPAIESPSAEVKLSSHCKIFPPDRLTQIARLLQKFKNVQCETKLTVLKLPDRRFQQCC